MHFEQQMARAACSNRSMQPSGGQIFQIVAALRIALRESLKHFITHIVALSPRQPRWIWYEFQSDVLMVVLKDFLKHFINDIFIFGTKLAKVNLVRIP